MNDLQPLQAKIAWAHRLTVIGLVALMVLGFVPSLLELFSTPRWMLDLAYAIPLLLFLPFIKPALPKRYAWLCFVILVYFCEGVLEAFTWPAKESLYGFATVALTSEIFIASMMATRWAGQQIARSPLPDA